MCSSGSCPPRCLAGERSGFCSRRRSCRNALSRAQGRVVLSPSGEPPPERGGTGSAGKKPPRPLPSTHQRVLIMQLKLRRRTRAAGENLPEMFRCLQQWIGLRADWRRALPGEPGPQCIQSPDQAAAQAIDRFQGERQPHLFRRRLAGKSRQPFQEPLPHQRSRERVARQHLRHEHRKRPAAPVAQTAIGTIHPLASLPLAAGAQGILAKGVTVPVQRADAAALRTGRLL